jgi:trehalose 6-phosphate phosphatase
MTATLTAESNVESDRPQVDPDQDCLFLDLDGTLAPLAPRPQDVIADSDRNRLLAALNNRLEGRLAVISGRTIEDVDRILDRTVLAVAGVHGLTRRSSDGALSAAVPDAGLIRVREAFQHFASDHPGLLVEDKSASIALHYRGAPQYRQAALALADRLAAETGLVAQHGAAVVELRTPGADKGDAVAAFLAEPPFAGRRPVFVGDDLTDEDAFAFVERAGGLGVLVGPARATAASHRLADVAAVLAWLEEIARA